MTQASQGDAAHSPLVTLARDAISAYVTEGRVLDVPAELPEPLQMRAAAFVSIKKFGELRGCIGTIEPACGNLAEEIVHNAISAATRDPRFFPIQSGELRDLVISVDVLGSPEWVSNLDDFDPRRYGMIVQCGMRRGLLLPDLEGVDSPHEQFEIACRKAGIPPGTPVEMYRFVVDRYY